MADDFVLKVQQISQYPLATSTGPGDFYLLQRGGVGGSYYSIPPSTLLSTALNLGGFLNLAPGSGIAWNGASLIYTPDLFTFNAPVNAPIVSAIDVFVNGQAAATQAEVNTLFETVVANSVLSFNSRQGNVQLLDTDILQAGGVLALNPHFWGVVTAPTLWNPNDATDTVATTSFVQSAIQNQAAIGCIVGSFNGRGGNVWLTAADISLALTQPGVYALANTPPSGDTSNKIATTAFVDDAIYGLNVQLVGEINSISAGLDQQFAPINSPNLTGIPTAPTAAQTVNSGQLATTAFVHAAVTASTTGVASWNGRTGTVTLTTADITGAGGAVLASPAFTGVATAPTAALGVSTTQLATCAFVANAIAAIGAGVTSWNTRTGAVVLTTADVTGVGGALLASPALSGVPTAPTAAPATNTTQLATCAFVTAAIAALAAPVTSFNGRTGAITLLSADLSAAGGALLVSPAFTGVPTGPTAAPGNNSTELATTAFVAAAVSAATAGVTSWNSRTGAVVLTAADLTGVGGALLAGPTFSGVPSAPTAAPGTNTTQLATCAFVTAAVAGAAVVSSFNSRTGAVTLLGSDVSAAGGALLASPAFTGTPTAPTQSPGTSNTDIATTAFVANAVTAAGGVTSFNTRAGAVTLNSTDITNAGGALLASPALSGVPTAPTASGGVNTTQIATCAFVQAAIPAASATLPLMNGTASAGSVSAWSRGDHVHPTDTTRAPIASPALTGTPTSITPTAGDNSTNIATTAFVHTAVAGVTGGSIIGQQVFSTAGAFTYTPTTGMGHCIVECVGAGGGGGGLAGVSTDILSAAGGGAGGYSRKLLTAATIGASQTGSVGAAGTAGSGNTAAGSGGPTYLGPSGSPLCQANGGGRAGTGTSASVAFYMNPGLGGTVTGAVGDLTIAGNNGERGFFAGGVNAATGGSNGGGSYFGGAGAGALYGAGTANVNGSAGTSGGGGGGGFNATGSGNVSGGAGGVGLVIITEYT